MSNLNWIAVFTILSSFLFAERTSAQVKKKTAGVSFSAIALSNIPEESLYVRDGKKFLPLEVGKSKRSIPYKFIHAKSFEIYTENDDPEIPYKLVGEAPFKAGAKVMLYFLRQADPKDTDTLPITVFGVDDSSSKFPKSSFRFINFTKIPLVVEFNKKKVLMQPHDTEIAKLTMNKAGAWMPFIVKNRQGKIFGGTRLFSHSENREMVLIFPPKKGSKRLDIRFFSD